MKIYCNSCDKVQPVIIDHCKDAKTGEPFEDIVCTECKLVIASGTGIESKDEPYWRRVARLKEEMLRVSYEENKLLKEALAQPEQKPVMLNMSPPATQRDRWMYEQGRLAERDPRTHTTPSQRKPLTDEEIDALWLQHDFIRAPDRKRQAFARAIEAAHGIKGDA